MADMKTIQNQSKPSKTNPIRESGLERVYYCTHDITKPSKGIKKEQKGSIPALLE
jgi:hypothetical protein